MQIQKLRYALALSAMALGVMQPAQAVEEGDTTNVYVTGTLVETPDCTINNDKPVVVNFGDEMITRLVDGERYRTNIEYSITCKNLAKNALALAISGSTADFGTGLLRTDKEGLGLRLYHGTKIISPNYTAIFNYGVTPTFSAVPVAQDNTTLTAGTFTATATMVIAYQ